MSEISFGKKLRLVLVASAQMISDYFLCLYLRRMRHDPYRMTDEKLDTIKRVDRIANPEEKSVFESMEKASDMEIMGPCTRLEKLYVLTGDNWYLIIVRELFFVSGHGFSSTSGKCSDMLTIYRELLNMFNGKKGFAYCREDTTYQIIQLLVMRGTLRLLEDRVAEKEGFRTHRVMVRIKGTGERERREHGKSTII